MKKGKAGYEGYLIDLMEKIAKHAGFVYTIKEVPYGMYGEEQDGKWNGMIGQLIRKVSRHKQAPRFPAELTTKCAAVRLRTLINIG